MLRFLSERSLLKDLRRMRMGRKAFSPSSAVIAVLVLSTIVCGALLAMSAEAVLSHNAASSASSRSQVSHWKTYRNDRYAFEVRYPRDASVVEHGPDPYELQLREGKTISGTQAPLLDSIEFRDRQGKTIVTVEIPDWPVVSRDYDWWLRPCGQEGFADIKLQKRTIFAGYKALYVISVMESDKQELHFYCVNFPKNPIIVVFPGSHKRQASRILSTFKFLPPSAPPEGRF